MDSLPAELRENIIDYLRDNIGNRISLASYASVSKQWKLSIEKYTFRILRLNSPDFSSFAEKFIGENISRRAALRELTVEIKLSPRPPREGCCAVTQCPPDRKADDASFSKALLDLFSILADIDSRTSESSPLYLQVANAYWERKGQYYSETFAEPCVNEWHTLEEIMRATANFGPIALLKDTTFPTVKGVTAFEITQRNQLEHLDSSYITAIAKALVDLEWIAIETMDSYRHGRIKRIEKRAAFLDALCHVPAERMRKVRLTADHILMDNESAPVHKLVETGNWDNETWFLTAKLLSTWPCLSILHLKGGVVICLDFFKCVTDTSRTPFSALRELVLEFAPETADGRWFYKKDERAFEKSKVDPKYTFFWEQEYDDPESRSVGSEEGAQIFGDGPVYERAVTEERFRSLPDEETMAPFLVDAARAVQKLPHLKKFRLKLITVEDPGLDYDLTYPFLERRFEVCYLKAGEPRSPKPSRLQSLYLHPYSERIPIILADEKYLTRNRLYWRVGNWTPWVHVQDTWLEAVGMEAKFVFLSEEEENWESRSQFWKAIYVGEF